MTRPLYRAEKNAPAERRGSVFERRKPVLAQDLFWLTMTFASSLDAPRSLHTGVLNPSPSSPLSLVSPPPNSRQSCNESSGFGPSLPSKTLPALDRLSALGSRPPIPFRAARTPFGVRCRHFDSAARTTCCRPEGWQLPRHFLGSWL